METIDVKSGLLRDMAKAIKTVPTNICCKKCGNIAAGLLPNNTQDNYIYGIVVEHYRIVWGIHTQVTIRPHEEFFCLCTKCGKNISIETLIPETFKCNSPHCEGGHFLTISKLELDGKTKLLLRYQTGLENFREILKLIE